MLPTETLTVTPVRQAPQVETLPPAPEAKDTPAPEQSGEDELLDRIRGGPPPPSTPPGPPPSSGTFDRVATAAVLGAIDVQACKKQGGLRGQGSVLLWLDPSGTVSSAQADSGPYPGTPQGDCIERKFRRARVPPFTGGPVSVRKSFSLK
jgi:hypothetical protein